MEQLAEMPVTLDMLREISQEIVNDYRRAYHAFPKLSWGSSASPGMISDGIAAEIAKKLGVLANLDGQGADLPELNLEVTAGKSVMKSNPHKYSKGAARFLWLRRTDHDARCGGWAGKIEVRYGILEPQHFGKRSDDKDYHGVSVPKKVSLERLQVILEIEPDPEPA